MTDSFAHTWVNDIVGNSWDLFSGGGMFGKLTEEYVDDATAAHLRREGAANYPNVDTESDPTRVKWKDFIARAEQDFESREQSLGGSRGDDDLLGVRVESVPGARLLRDRDAQLLNAGGRGVVCFPAA